MQWQSYEVMTSVDRTLQRLMEEQGQARVVAGGTDLMVQIRGGTDREGALTLLDISQIDGMRGIREAEGYLVIGAATTVAEIASSDLVRTKARALAQGAGWLGSPQIRNVATIGGNVVNAQPAGDTSVPLVALGAEAMVISPEGEGWVPVEDLFRGVGESAIDSSRELVSRFRVPVDEVLRSSSVMVRLAKRKTFTLPTLSVAVSLQLSEKGERIRKVRIVVAPVGPIPWRAGRAEEILKNGLITQDNVGKAAAAAREDARPRDSLRGGAEYRKDMVEVLTHRSLTEALSELRKEPYG